jgi:hypothetical protein
MGQATVDLPDPLDQQPPPADAGGVDDLLAQLAGDEIDRLLAEADAEAPAAAAAAPIDARVDPIDFSETPAVPVAATTAAAEPVPRLSPNSPLARLNALADLPPEPGDAPADGELATPPQTAAAPPAAAEAESTDDNATVDAATLASLDAIASELDATPSSDDGIAAGAGEVAPAEPAPATPGLLAPGAVEKVLADEAAGRLGSKPVDDAPPADDAGTTAAERGALGADVDAELAEAAEGKAALGAAPAAAAVATSSGPISSSDLDAVLGDADGEPPLPLYLRPLEWLNAPLAACSPAVRDLVGKFAIITTMNALAVLVYVMFFRR